MTQREAYNLGKDRGFNIASWQELPEIGSNLDEWDSIIEWDGSEINSPEDQLDAFQAMVWCSESHNRGYSPFEFTAHAINISRNPDECWDRFTEGIERGIHLNIKSRFPHLI